MSMRKSQIGGNLPRFFTNFRRLEEKPNPQQKSQPRKDQQLVISALKTSAETVQIPERDSSPNNTMTVLTNARPGCNADEITAQMMGGVPKEVNNPERSVGSSVNMDFNIYCEEELRWLNEGEIKTLVEVSEESLAKILGGLIVSERVVDESMHVDVFGDLEEGGLLLVGVFPIHVRCQSRSQMIFVREN